jgi:hypothetical protein
MGRDAVFEQLSQEVDLAAAAQTSDVIPAVAGKRIAVYGIALVAGGAGNITFADTTGTITGDMPMTAAGDGIVFPPGVRPWFRARVGEPLKITQSAAQTVDGVISFAYER